MKDPKYGKYIDVNMPPIPPLPPLPFGRFNPGYPGNLKMLAGMAREKFEGEIYLLMSEKTKAVADTTGDTEIMEKATGLKILTVDHPYGLITIGQLNARNQAVIFPAGVQVDVELPTTQSFGLFQPREEE